jgi:CHAT domain-containing protein/tetratricopeptide (TPR) repeat protein
MSAPTLLAALLLLPGAEAAKVRLGDNFTTNTLKNYRVKGGVKWAKGRVTLGPGARLTRPLRLGHTVELRAVARLPAGEEAHGLHFRLRGSQLSAEVMLARADGKNWLVNLQWPPEMISLGKAGVKEEAWELRLELRYGVARARAWKSGTKEPAAWQTSRYSGETIAVPRSLAVHTGRTEGGTLIRWSIKGDPAPPPLTEQQQQLADQAETLHKQAFTLMRRAKNRDALAKVKQVRKLWRQVYGDNHPNAAMVLNSLGAIYQELGEETRARTYHERALALCRKLLGDEHPDTAGALNNLGRLLRIQGEYRRGRQCLEQALAINAKVLGPIHPRTAYVLNNLASLLDDMGDYAAARRYYEQALAVRQKVRGRGHLETANVLNNLGGLLHRLGEYATARKYYEESLAIALKELGPNHPGTAATLNNLGGLLTDAGRYEEARKVYRRCLAAYRKARGRDHPDTAIPLSNLGSLYHTQGKFRQARRYFDQVLAIYRKARGDNHPDTARCLEILGQMLYDQGKYPEARSHLERALAVQRQVLGRSHPGTARTLNRLGLVLAAEGKWQPAWKHLRNGAAALADSNRQYLAGSAERDFARRLLATRYYFTQLVSLAARRPELARAHGLDLAAAVLDWKAGAGQALSARQEALVLRGNDQARKQYQELLRVRRRLAQVLMRGPGRESAARYRQTRAALEKQQDDLERELARSVDAFAALQRRRRAGPRAIAARLPAGSVLVELVKSGRYDFQGKQPGKRWGPPHYDAVLLWQSPGKAPGPVVRFVPLGEAKEIEAALGVWRAAVPKGTIGPAAERRLRQRVWEPLAKVIPKGTRRLFIAPDGELALLPFEAIRLGDGKYLVERLQISYLTGGRDLMPQPQTRGKPGPALLLADPDYDALGEKPGPRVSASGSRSGEFTKRRFRFRRLPGFRREAKAVARMLRAARRPLVLRTGKEATEEVLAAARRPRLVYVITHGFFLPDLAPPPGGPGRRGLKLIDPGPKGPAPSATWEEVRLRSGLALAGANRWQERSRRGLSDGLLTALEVQDLDLWGTELVVLSACETGLGAVQVGEGVLGLRRAFQSAGARTVLASLWQVPDKETARLMGKFFRHWLRGKPKAEALRRAQRELLAELRKDPDPKRQKAPPLYWAGFICHGQPE